jgi:hypothetical protein
MSDYITTADITDEILKATALSTLLAAKIVRSTLALNDLGERLDVDSTEMAATPHILVVDWTCAEMHFDLMGKNKQDGGLEMDIHFQKYKEHNARRADVEGKINYAVLTGVVIDGELDRPSSTTRIYRR